jgi:flagellar hook-length control protein FliK
MRALLREPDAAPVRAVDRALPVPGTFFRSPPAAHAAHAAQAQAQAQAEAQAAAQAAAGLDSMLESMAEGLLVGTDGGGASQIQVTLRDDFFRGTELRVSFDAGEVRAQLVPPDRDTYRLLSSELHRLRSSLEERGLKVGALDVVEP